MRTNEKHLVTGPIYPSTEGVVAWEDPRVVSAVLTLDEEVSDERGTVHFWLDEAGREWASMPEEVEVVSP